MAGKVTPDGLEILGDYFAGKSAYTQSDAWFKNDSVRAVLTVQCSFFAHIDSIKKILGVNQRIGNNLVRRIPWQHPLYPGLYATEIAGVKFMTPTGAGNGFPEAKTVHLIVVFTGLEYEALKDADVAGDESKRFTSVHCTSRTQFLNEEKGQTYSFTANAPAGYQNKKLRTPPTRLCQHVIVQVKWWLIAADFCLDSFGLPRNILQQVGRVNDAVFMGRNPGTMLLMDPEVEMLPGYSGIVNQNPKRLCHIALTFDYFDPPTTGGKYGHLCAALPGHPEGKYAEVKSDPFYYDGVLVGGGAAPLYELVNFGVTLFKAV